MDNAPLLTEELGSLAQGFMAWLHEAVWNRENLYALVILGSVLLLMYIVVKFAPQKIQRLADRALAGTKFTILSNHARGLVFLAGVTLLLWVSDFTLKIFYHDYKLIFVFRNIFTAILVIRATTLMVKKSLSLTIMVFFVGAFFVLETLDLRDLVTKFLATVGITIGGINITLYKVLVAVFVVLVMDLILAEVRDRISERLSRSTQMDPSQKVLLSKTVNILYIAVLVMIGFGSLGLSFTTLAVFTGAIGIGIGLGLQTIILNVLSGFFILMDRSIKPGDVIAIGDSYGWVNALRSRYISIVTRDGIEHLIPNEKFIKEPVENWTFSTTKLRIRIPIGVAYDTDLKLASELMEASARTFERILSDPGPVCLLKEFGDSSINLELRVWIEDPANGMANIKSAVMHKVWENFQKHNIEIPFPQRDVRVIHSQRDATLSDTVIS